MHVDVHSEMTSYSSIKIKVTRLVEHEMYTVGEKTGYKIRELVSCER